MFAMRIAAAVAALAIVTASPAARAQEFVNILTGGTAGVYYPLGVALSKIYAEKIPNVRPSVQSTKASVENLNLIQSGKGEVAQHLHDVAAADRIAVHAGDHGLLHALDALVEVHRGKGAGIEVAVLEPVLLAADAEEAVAGAGQHDHAGARLAPDRVDAVADLVAHDVIEHVAVVRPVQRDGADRAVFLVEDGLVAHARSPASRCCSSWRIIVGKADRGRARSAAAKVA
jgi:hypothetical protein